MEPEHDFRGWPWTWSDLAIAAILLGAILGAVFGAFPSGE